LPQLADDPAASRTLNGPFMDHGTPKSLVTSRADSPLDTIVFRERTALTSQFYVALDSDASRHLEE
jgi:hypothetical protein